MPTDTKLTLYFDVLSPFAYLAFHTLTHAPSLASLRVTYTPVFLPGIMALTGNTPPMASPHKGAYSTLDLARYARRHNIPLAPVARRARFPTNTLVPLRCLWALQARADSAAFMRLTAALYEAYWQRGEDIGTAEVVGRVVREALGEAEAERVLREARGEQAKRGVEQNTKRAVETGCFGLPWFVVERGAETEVFWGFERLVEVVRVAGGVWEEGEEALRRRREEGPRGEGRAAKI